MRADRGPVRGAEAPPPGPPVPPLLGPPSPAPNPVRPPLPARGAAAPCPTTRTPSPPRNKVVRRHERGRYDKPSVHAILDGALVAHIAYVMDGQPFCTPTAFWREGGHLYWHGSSASRMIRFQKPGVPVCATVMHLDALVLARSAFHHSVNYRSVMAFGNRAAGGGGGGQAPRHGRVHRTASTPAAPPCCARPRPRRSRRPPSSSWGSSRRRPRSATPM